MKTRSDRRRSPVRGHRGFTLLELLIVVIIIGVLATAGIAKYQDITRRARRGSCLGNQDQIVSSVKLVETDKGPLPKDTTIRFQYNGIIDDSVYTGHGSPSSEYRVYNGTLPVSWGKTQIGGTNQSNTIVLDKAEDMRIFRCPESASFLGGSYTAHPDYTNPTSEYSGATRNLSYTFAKRVTSSRGTGSTYTVPTAWNDDPLEGFNWIRNQVEWNNNTFAFCRRWGLRDPEATGMPAADLNGQAGASATGTDYDFLPAAERSLAHSSWSPAPE